MKRRFKTSYKSVICALLCSLALLSCTSAKIVSSHYNGYDGEITNLFLQIQSTKRNSGLMNRIARELKYTFETRGMQVQAFYYGDSLNEQETQNLKQSITAFNADVVMEVIQESHSEAEVSGAPSFVGDAVVSGSYRIDSSSLVSITITTVGAQTPFWKAKVKTEASQVASVSQGVGAGVTSQKIIEALVTDGIIPDKKKPKNNNQVKRAR